MLLEILPLIGSRNKKKVIANKPGHFLSNTHLSKKLSKIIKKFEKGIMFRNYDLNQLRFEDIIKLWKFN